MAFQPMVDLEAGRIFAYESLVRGADGSGASEILASVTSDNLYAFDQSCRVKAIELAARLPSPEPAALLSINFMPNAVYEPRACIQKTLAAARTSGFDTRRLLFEFTENEKLDEAHLLRILSTYRSMGFRTAIDDFGAGFAGLTLLARWQPDLVKIDMELVRGVERDPVRRALVRGVAGACREMGIRVLGEGVETEGESATLRELGVHLQQGFWFGRPAFERMEPPLRGCAPA